MDDYEQTSSCGSVPLLAEGGQQWSQSFHWLPFGSFLGGWGRVNVYHLTTEEEDQWRSLSVSLLNMC